MITIRAPIPPGDYNANGVVDIDDYTVFRDNLGQSIVLAGENPSASTPGLVDDEDYDFWKENFDSLAGTGTLAGTAAIPEPSTLGLLALGATGLAVLRRRKRD